VEVARLAAEGEDFIALTRAPLPSKKRSPQGRSDRRAAARGSNAMQKLGQTKREAEEFDVKGKGLVMNKARVEVA
jgi:hypothetical protein